MTNTKILTGSFILSAAILLFAGCKSDNSCCTMPAEKSSAASTTAAPAPKTATSSTSTPAAAPIAPAALAPTASATTASRVPVRIKAGPGEAFKDADGNQWIPETGFNEGDSIERSDVQIANTKTPAIYRSEHYSMASFSYPLPNGKYIVKLHFCETFDGITGPGGRVFAFNVEGKQFNDFDVWVKAGGPMKAYVETVPVEVKDGKLDITFTPKEENPQINGIEILPAS
jgi:alcohol dehydrogenase (cytochrome c)